MNSQAARTMGRAGAIAVALIAAAVVSPQDQTALAAGGNSITTPDPTGGSTTSLALASSGNPVVAYEQNYGLKLMHCNDPDCSGNDESVVTLTSGTINDRVVTTSLVLDAAGSPVIAFSRRHQLMTSSYTTAHILHCNDEDCAGGDEPPTFNVGGGILNSAFALDASGNPVAIYTTGDLFQFYPVVLHCNDPLCTGADESATTPTDSSSATGGGSLKLDASGNPVFTYVETNSLSQFDLRLLHCNDPNCAGSGDNSNLIEAGAPYTTLVGGQTSMELDGSGFPAISYFGYDNTSFSNGELRFARCGNANCTGGAALQVLDTDGDLSASTLTLGGGDIPVISYHDAAQGDLKILTCGNPACGSANTIVVPDSYGYVGAGPSLVLDGVGKPVASYSGGGLKLLHCANPTCVEPDGDVDGCPTKDEGQTTPGSEMTGGLRDDLNFWDFFDTPDDTNVRDKSVAGTDFFRLLARFGASGDDGIDPLSAPPAAPAYHTAFDRGASSGPNPWNLTAADGAIAGTDFFAILVQFGHTCL